MRAYCLFREGGASFAYHIASGRFIGTSPLAHELLELRLGNAVEEANAAFIGRHPAATDVLEDVAKLEEAGFFEPANPPDKDDDEFEAELDGRFSGPCNTLVLSVASGCNLACRYCYCGTCRDELPDRGLMTEATALKAVDGLFASADPGSDVRVTFFGGEPLLYPDTVCAIHRAGTDLGIGKRQLITNGFFSKKPERIEAVARDLAGSGINDLLLSVDAFHQETIPLEPVRFFAECAVNAGIPVRLSPAWLVSREDSNPYNNRTREILRAFESLSVPVGNGNVIFPAGNALKYLREYFDENTETSSPYDEDPRDLRTVSFSPNGDVLNGNVYRADILEILETYCP